jgi:RNA-directed DNA polymerase
MAAVCGFPTADQERKKSVPTGRLGGGKLTRRKHSFRCASFVRVLAPAEAFALELHPDKTRIIEFGRFAHENRRARGQGKPETFAFLGFTHIFGRTREGRRLIRRHTLRERLNAKLRQVKATLRRMRHLPIPEQGRYLRLVLNGFYNYYAVPTNFRALNAFYYHVLQHWLRCLRRRSQRHRLTWRKMMRLAERWLPSPKLRHPYPDWRFDVMTRGGSPVR